MLAVGFSTSTPKELRINYKSICGGNRSFGRGEGDTGGCETWGKGKKQDDKISWHGRDDSIGEDLRFRIRRVSEHLNHGLLFKKVKGALPKDFLERVMDCTEPTS